MLSCILENMKLTMKDVLAINQEVQTEFGLGSNYDKVAKNDIQYLSASVLGWYIEMHQCDDTKNMHQWVAECKRNLEYRLNELIELMKRNERE